MPRTVEEIVAQADALAKKFEAGDLPGTGKVLDGTPLRAVREAFEDFALAQKRLAERISVAKAMGHSWAMIGAMIGTSGEAARQRYSKSPAVSAQEEAVVKTLATGPKTGRAVAKATGRTAQAPVPTAKKGAAPVAQTTRTAGRRRAAG